MKLDDLKQQLAELQAACPPIPRGLPAEHPDFISWYHQFAAWTFKKDKLLAKVNTRGWRFDHKGNLIKTGVAA